jgi:hypothetical protein
MVRLRALTITAAGAGLALAAATLATPAVAGTPAGDTPHPVIDLNGPRGVDALGHGKTLVTESDGSFSLVVEHADGTAHKYTLGTLGGDFAPAISAGPNRTVYLLTGGGPPPEEAASGKTMALRSERADVTPADAATLFKWRPGWDHPVAVADIAAYQATDPDPYDLEGFPEDSNPFGVQALGDGTVLVADAAGNDLLRVWPGTGHIETVARLKPRVVEVPEGLPELPPEQGGPLPPAGTPIPSEGVATSVTVGSDGYWYIGELRGFPATPGTSEIWKVKPGTVGATCDPEHPWRGSCKRFKDGLTSIVDLARADDGVYAVELSKMSWFQLELGVPGSEIGGLFQVKKRGVPWPRMVELAKDQLPIPGGVDATWDGDVYVTAPLFGPGALWKLG